MVRYWRLSHRLYSPQAWTIHLSEEPAWAHVVETVWNGLCVVTRGWVGGHGQSRLYNSVVWRVPIGRSRWDRSEPGRPWLENSLGSVLYSVENWMLTRSAEHGHEIVEIPITEEIARQIDEEFVEDILNLHDEAPGADLAGKVRRADQ